MKKVVLLAPTYPPAGGIAGWTNRMMKAKLKNNWEVVVVDEKSIGKREIFGKAGERNYLTEVKRCFIIWSQLWKALNDKNVKVVHSCIPSHTLSMLRELFCALITKLRRRKFIIHFRCTVPNTTKGKLGHVLLRWICTLSDSIISLNEQTSKYLAEITDTPISLIPNFISENEVSESHFISPRLENVLYVGGLVEDKGVGDILQIAARLPDIQFRIIGKGDNEYENLANARGLLNVHFLGEKSRQEVKEELSKADVFLFMTFFRGEGFSNALCEAMAQGLPCVVTDWAANADMVGNGGGFVVPVGGVEEAVSALNQLRDPEIREKNSIHNINKVKMEYIQSVIIDKYVDVYEMLI